MSNLEMLEIFKSGAIEQLAENDRYIATLHDRIAVLEYHLGRCREAAFQVVIATAGVLPMEYVSDAKAEKKKGKAS